MRSVSNTRLTYTPRAGATPEGERTALVAIYKFVLEAHARKKAAAPSGQDDAKGDNDYVRAKTILPQ